MEMFSVSLITCTYNPSREVFEKVLDAIAKLDLTGIPAEYIIVDNNSATAVEEEAYIGDFLLKNPWVKLVKEKTPGLNKARICGFNHSKYSTIVFIDDDVALAEDYVQALKELSGSFPDVAAWNAGVIHVEYTGKPDKWFYTKGKQFYQEDHIAGTITGDSIQPANYWPFGTGLVLKRFVFEEYKNRVLAGVYNMSGRNAGKMISGEDSQMVHCAITMGFKVGRSHLLKLAHLTSHTKANIKYLESLNFGLAYSFQYFKKEAIPEFYQPLSNGVIFKIFLYQTINVIPHFDFKSYRVKMNWHLGTMLADIQIKNTQPSFLVRALLFFFKANHYKKY